jgi:hypothetical protein
MHVATSLLLVLVCLCQQSFSADDENEREFSGKFETKSGSSCNYQVLHFDDDGIVGLRVKCECHGLSTKLTYSCTYIGKPNICSGFNESYTAQAEFYSELADYIKGELLTIAELSC